MELQAIEFAEALSDEDYQAQAGFRYAIRRFVHSSEEQARAAGITPQQHLLLLMLRGHPAYPVVTIKDLADRLQIRHHSASLLVDRGVKRGLLLRTGDAKDRRKVCVSLTEEGQRLLEQITCANRLELRALDQHFNDMQHSLLRAFRTTIPEGFMPTLASEMLETMPGAYPTDTDPVV
jgi:DNA-binding MarR family transcriptional regulator